MSIFDCFQHIGDVGCTDIPEGIGSFWKGLKKLTEYVPEDIPTGDYSEPAESLEDAEDNETQCAQYDLTDGLSKVSSMPIEDIPRGDYGEPEIVPALVSFRHDQKPECIPTGDYTELEKGKVPEVLAIRTSSKRAAMLPPDISSGLGSREESRDIVALESYVVSQGTWMKYDGVLCLYHSPCWRKLVSEDAALREIRTMLYEYDDIRSSLTASDYHRLYRGLMSHPDIPELSNLEPPCDTINCNDGALNLISFQAHLPCPEDNFFHAFDLSCEQILDPPMRGSYFEMFVDQISAGNPDVRRQLLEMLAIAMTGTQLKYFYVMLGPSNSGKSQWGRFVQELLGRENVESVQSIADFGGRFTTGSLCGKLLASCLDLPNGTLPQNAIGVLKTFCGDDSVKGEVKYKQSFTYYRKPLLMMAGNHSIKVNRAEHEDALFNRMIVVPFADPNVEESERIPELYQRFLDEAPYIVHEACMAYQELAARNWVPTRVPVPAEYAPQEGNQALLAAKAFVEDCISFETGSQVTTAELYDAYLEYAEEEGYPQLNMTSFSRALSKMLKQAIPEAATVKRVNDENVRGYSNITLT